MDHHSEDRPEIVFFDVETIYNTPVIVEFGAIFVCPYTLTELRRPYSTLVRPVNPSDIPTVFERRNGITRDALADAPSFADIADTVYELLHDRIWAGHNILRFDCIHIRKAFSELNRPPPEPKATVDSLPLLTETFGKRAGDMKMASLATYFGLGQQPHRSLDDVRMNLEVVKCCATIMFLESSFPNVFKVNGKSLVLRGSSSSSDMKMKSISHVASHQYTEEQRPTFTMCNSSVAATSNLIQQQFFGFPPQMRTSKGHESITDEQRPTFTSYQYKEEPRPTFTLCSPIVVATNNRTQQQLFGFPPQMCSSKGHEPITEEQCPTSINHQYKKEQRPTFTLCSSSVVAANNLAQRQIFGFPPQMCNSKGHESIAESSPDMKRESVVTSSSNTFVVLKPHEIFISSLTGSFISSPYHSCQRIQLLHNGSPFQISCADLKIRFGINDRFQNKAGLPKWNIVVESSQSLCEVLGACDAIARNLFLQSGGSSEWKPLVTRKDDFNSPTVKLQIAISKCGDATIFETEISKKESSRGTVQRLRFNKVDTQELSSLCTHGNLVDAIFSLDQYEYQRRAGIRLVAKKLIFHKQRDLLISIHRHAKIN